MERYTAVVRYSEADALFVAWFAELPDIRVHGSSRAAALAELDVAAELALEVMAEEGVGAPMPHAVPSASGQFSLRLPRSLHQRLADLASADGVSLNSLCMVLLERGVTLGHRTAPPKANLSYNAPFGRCAPASA